jgi:thiamine-phosphate diphosphorylase
MVSRPVICLVTDRRRLAQRLELDPDDAQIGDRLADLVAMAAQAGIDLVQVRENDLPDHALVGWVHRFVGIVRGTSTRIVVNDRLDVALAAGAHGVHLKDGPAPIERIRAAAPGGFLVGQSIHSPERAADTSADYLVFGTLFPTRSKPEAAAFAGLAALASAVRHARVPVLGIGGVKLIHVARVAGTGASGIAAVDLFLPAGPGLVAPLHEIASEVRLAFDTAGPAP